MQLLLSIYNSHIVILHDMQSCSWSILLIDFNAHWVEHESNDYCGFIIAWLVFAGKH